MAKITVRQATSLDIVKIFRLLAEAQDPPNIRLGRVNANKAFQFVLAMIQGCYVAVADLGGNVVGVCALGYLHPPYTDDVLLNLEQFYVQPKYRPTGVPRALMRNALREAGKHDLRVRVHLCGRDVDNVGVEALEALGLRPAGQVFISRQDDAQLHDSGTPAVGDDVGGDVDNDSPQPDDARSSEPSDDQADGPDGSDEPWAGP
jgi:ribosomal protein S18 acetylase RimI-like enzyme